ncbi:MAG TPA: endolytic transglycosylase MltG [Gemmatimonadales bacterium]|nr:endolytic transglycosylase MltG [Gemmatimonadales bacterium]
MKANAERRTRNTDGWRPPLFRVPTSAFAVLLAIAACGKASDAPPVAVTIPPGATLDAAIDSLARHGLVQHTTTFHWYARLRGLGRDLKTGEYLVAPDASWSEIVTTLERGRGVEVRFTVREGLMLTEIADVAKRELRIPRDSLVSAARDPVVRGELGLPPTATNVEGYLFPTTYIVQTRSTARDLVRLMAREFLAQWDSAWDARLDTLHMTRYQLVTLASIVESEVRYAPDRPFVSAVYHNRLKRGMKLEADPTILYAYQRRLKRVWEKNLAVQSPYNTYLHAGLPPGPISQPGRASLLAALYPAPVPFLFFVAQPDGKHIFSTNFAEHEAAIRTVKRLGNGAREQRSPDR